MKRIYMLLLLGGVIVSTLQPLYGEKKQSDTVPVKVVRGLWNTLLIAAGTTGVYLARQNYMKTKSKVADIVVKGLHKDISLFKGFVGIWLIADGIEGLYDLYLEHQKEKEAHKSVKVKIA